MSNIFDLPESVLAPLGQKETALLSLLDDPDEEVYAEVRRAILESAEDYQHILSMIMDYAEVRDDELLLDRVKMLMRGHRLASIIAQLELEELDLMNFFKVILMIDEMIMMKNIEKPFILNSISMFQKELWLQLDMGAAPEQILDELAIFFFQRMQFRNENTDNGGEYITFIKSIAEAKANEFVLFMTLKAYTDFFELDLEPIKVNNIYLLGLRNPDTGNFERVVEFPSGEIYTKELLPKYFHQDELNSGTLHDVKNSYEALVKMYIEDYLNSNPTDSSLNQNMNKLIEYLDQKKS